MAVNRLWAVWSSAWLLCGCTWVDLSSRIGPDQCHFDFECATLNDPTATGTTACHPYVCGPKHYCERAPLDADHDGFVSMGCEPDPSQRDCDDTEPTVHPGAPEVCDQRDNDCDRDYAMDEGVLDTSIQRSVIDLHAPEPAGEIGFGLNGAADLFISYALEPEPYQVALHRIGLDVARPALEPSFTNPPLRARTTSITPLSPTTAATGFFSMDERHAVHVAAWNISPSAPVSALFNPAAHAASCGQAEPCAGMGLAAPTDTPAVMSDVLGSQVLVAYTRDTQPNTGLCESGASRVGRPMFANLFSAKQPALQELTRNAVPIGSSGERRSPALLAIPGSTPNGQPYGWLVAYPDPEGALVLAQLSAAHADQPSITKRLTLRATEGPLHAAHMAFGDTSKLNELHFGIVAERGCGEQSEVVFGLVNLELADDGKIALKLTNGLTPVGDSPAQHSAGLAFQLIANAALNRESQRWAIAFRDEFGLRARLMTGAGRRLGDTPYLLIAAQNTSPTAEAVAVTIGTNLGRGANWFTVFSYARDPQSGQGRIAASELRTCPPP